MPFALCPPIEPGRAGLWGEGPSYERTPVYDFAAPGPPVHYDAHLLRPHSLPHAESAGHVVPGGAPLDRWFGGAPSPFVGPAWVARPSPAAWTEHVVAGRHVIHTRIDAALLREALASVGLDAPPARLLLDVARPDGVPHGSEVAFTLAPDAAAWLVQPGKLLLFGTRFRSTDFQPGSRERPIHRALFDAGAAILECLDLAPVPAGRYVLVAPPLPLAGATEAPVAPLLFTREEWRGLDV